MAMIMMPDEATLSARLRQIVKESPADLKIFTFWRAQEIIRDTFAAGCSFYAYGDGGFGTCYGPDAQPDPHGREIVADKALHDEIWRQMLIIQGPENTLPSMRMTAEDVEVWDRNRGAGVQREARS